MPGEGKTTVSVNLALSLARKGARVILVDADLRRPSVKAALGIREPSQGLIDAAALDDPAQSASLLASVEGSTLRLLAGDTPRKEARQAPVRKIFRVIDFLRTQADYIILDTPPCGLLADSVSLARAADCAIYVLGAGAVQACRRSTAFSIWPNPARRCLAACSTASRPAVSATATATVTVITTDMATATVTGAANMPLSPAPPPTASRRRCRRIRTPRTDRAGPSAAT